jgi:GntR family transcriptional regulator
VAVKWVIVVESVCQPGSITMPALPMSSEEIAADIAARIKSGEYAAGDRLPSYRELMDIYSVSYGTIGSVMVRLRMMGLTVTSKGRGVYVAE